MKKIHRVLTKTIISSKNRNFLPNRQQNLFPMPTILEREKVFWRNYFFHCAFTRYEAGLSIDEIWSDAPPPPPTHSESGHVDEEIVDFQTTTTTDESTGAARTTTMSTTTTSTTNLGPDDTVATTSADYLFEDDKPSSTESPTSEYEMIDSVMGNDDANDDDEDAFAGEMDELEAEIAQALGD